MKVIMPSDFELYAMKYSLTSMIKSVSLIAFEIYNSPDKTLNKIAGYRNYSINNGLIKDTVLVVQTWLIDMLYDLVKLNKTGHSDITRDETLRLIHLYNSYADNIIGKRLNNRTDALLNVYGFFGEQKRFESHNDFFKDFSREKYIMEVISDKKHNKNTSGINVKKEFYDYTGFSTDEFSLILLSIFGYFSTYSPNIKSDKVQEMFNIDKFDNDDIIRVLERYSCNINELSNSRLGRQLLYGKPFIKINDEYILSNPFLMLALFTNSNYWVMRNKYLDSSGDKQKFVNAFGSYFEIYVEEILNNCLCQNEYYNIPECSEKRADWHLKLGNYNFIVEQKSGLSILGIKQTQPDLKLMKEYVIKNWGEAVMQLDITEKALGLNDAIKIILLYEDYYKSECLDLLFDINAELKELNNKKFWLMTIREFEMLMITYKDNPDLFFEVINDKDTSELSSSKDGRDPLQIMYKHGIKNNKYLDEFGVYNQFKKLTNTCN